MTLPSYAVDWRGHPACPCLATWLPVYEAELQRRGLLVGPIHIYQLIGGNPSSGGTHALGGAFDTAYIGDEGVWVARQMGADACWHRPFNWDGQDGIEHVHGVLTGCPHNSPARYQIDDVRAGLNGLANHGRDDGPRPLSNRSWREGIDWAEEQDMPSPKDWTPEDWAAVQEQLAKPLVKAIWDAAIDKSGTAAKVALRKVLGTVR